MFSSFQKNVTKTQQCRYFRYRPLWIALFSSSLWLHGGSVFTLVADNGAASPGPSSRKTKHKQSKLKPCLQRVCIYVSGRDCSSSADSCAPPCELCRLSVPHRHTQACAHISIPLCFEDSSRSWSLSRERCQQCSSRKAKVPFGLSGSAWKGFRIQIRVDMCRLSN